MDKLGLRELLRYGFTGILCTAIAAALDASRIEALVRVLGDVLAPLFALAVGAVVYIVFKSLVGDLFLWRLINWCHARCDKHNCKARFLETEYQVAPRRGLAAYALIRDIHFDAHLRERFHVQHSEVHLLYATAFVCGSVALCVGFDWLPADGPSWVSGALGAVAVITLIAGIVEDVVICRAERAALGSLEADSVRRTLARSGLLTGG